MDTKTKLSFSAKILLKIFVIIGLSLILLIPKYMIGEMIDEREKAANETTDEIAKKWGKTQCVAGPFILIPAKTGGKSENRLSDDLVIFPESLDIKGDINSQILHRNIYNVAVFQAPLTLKGSFNLPKELDDSLMLKKYQLNKAKYMFYVRDLRGLCDNVRITAGQQQEVLTTDENKFIGCEADLQDLFNGDTIAYSLSLNLKGSQGLFILPCGNNTSVTMKSDDATPSFTGGFLPNERNVGEKGFTASWKMIALNKSFPQHTSISHFKNSILSSGYNDYAGIKEMSSSESYIGINLKTGIDQYRQNTRANKYAYLIIILTFITVLIVELIKEKPIHIVQYLLVGVALVLFYSLLLSFSEFIAFGWAYLATSAMTITLVTAYMAAILKMKKTALVIGALLAALYLYIYILLSMQTLSLLVGSIGLFIILALIMAATQKINWYK